VSLKIEETFQVKAPVARVWAYLSDPRQVVNCLPGAELTSVESDTTFLGKVKVKVGPVTAAYNGKVTITERDDAAHVVKLVGDGRDASGGGSAKMTMTSTLAALGDGGTEVRVSADLDIVGKLAQFGRGMIESVNKQMFRQFTDCLRATLETPPVEPTEAAVAPTDATAAPTPTVASVGGTEPVRLLPIVLRAAWENLVGALRASWHALRRLVGRGTKL
jgi:carbon monoxide dehydrogenase subunit G